MIGLVPVIVLDSEVIDLVPVIVMDTEVMGLAVVIVLDSQMMELVLDFETGVLDFLGAAVEAVLETGKLLD